MDSLDLETVRGRRVVVGLSGGVDSAVAAMLLADAGADVHALHMTNWQDDDGLDLAAADLQDARRDCDELGIPLHDGNFAREYRDEVFAYFLREYRAGRTPNPDVLCNRHIKFGAFRRYAARLGAERVATGHYAALRHEAGEVRLYKARDRDKDQSYFLHAVPADALADAVFPLGGLTKAEVRALARDRGLPVFDKKDSTGICFIGERPFREFLSRWLEAEPGPIRTADGRTVGRHAGLPYYTIGQRQGLGIGGRDDADDAPWYVAAKDAQANALVVVQGDDPRLYAGGLVAADPTWIGTPPDGLGPGRACRAKVRHRQPDQDCRVRALPDGRLEVTFARPQRAVAPGQFVVFYDGDRCLGGATIAEARSAAPGDAANAVLGAAV